MKKTKLNKLFGFCDICWGIFGLHNKSEHEINELKVELHKRWCSSASEQATNRLFEEQYLSPFQIKNK